MQNYTTSAQLAVDTLHHEKTKGIPTGLIHIMEHRVIEKIACASKGAYKKDPYGVYFRMVENIGVNMVDQMLADNPLSMGEKGFEGYATENIPVIDDITINSAEACADHIERFYIPSIIQDIKNFNENQIVQEIIQSESASQRMLGPNILKTGYGHLVFPTLEYVRYGYENFFTCYALFPEIIDRLFTIQADFAVLKNKSAVKAFQTAHLPLYHRLDHDMADSRGLLTGMKSLEKHWVEQFARSIKPAVDAGFTLLWHCDGNLIKLIPYLLEAGINGFQGFQYEDGMDYIEICKMKDRLGQPLTIQAGVSVTRELPFGKPEDIKNQLCFLVENGPKTGLFLSMSSSCTPGTPIENIMTAVEGFKYYRTHGR
ncbi:MAG: hypothetical protein WCN92_10140 [Eubacteriales bacterium]